MEAHGISPGIFSARLLIDISYFITACLFILGLKRMSSPVTARSGIVWAGAGMAVATLVSFLYPNMSNYELIIAAIVVGSIVAWWSGKKVAMTDMPQMIALYNGMGGGAAAAIAAVELYRAAFANAAGAPVTHSNVVMSLAVVGGIIGAISFSGSLIAWAKLQGVLNKTMRFARPEVRQRPAVPGLAGRGRDRGAAPRRGSAARVADLRAGAAVRHRHDAAHRRRRHAGGDLAVQRPHRPGRGLRRLRARQRRHDHRRHGGGLGRHAAHAADGQGHEPLAGQCAVLGLRFRRRRRGHGGVGLDEAHRGLGRRRHDGLRARR